MEQKRGDGMSILIKGMEMPKHGDVLVVREYNGKTYIKHEGHLGFEGRLIELPPHGRLGDLDALYAEISNGNKAYNGIEGYDGKYPNIGNVDDCLDAIKYADTVIEAEGSET